MLGLAYRQWISLLQISVLNKLLLLIVNVELVYLQLSHQAFRSSSHILVMQNVNQDSLFSNLADPSKCLIDLCYIRTDQEFIIDKLDCCILCDSQKPEPLKQEFHCLQYSLQV